MSILLTFLFLEIGLRLFPDVIPLNLLIYFNEGPRAIIAHGRGLPVEKIDTILLERDDGGPDLRIFKPFTEITRPLKEYNTTITVKMDEVGFCNPLQNSYQLPTIDIITLGDSFTTCTGTVQPHEAWTSQLSTLTGYSTYNLGREGIGIHSYLQIFKRFGIQKSPKMVILNVYGGNDLRDARRYYRYTQVNNNMSEPEQLNSSSDSQDSIDEFLKEAPLGRYSYASNLILSVVKYWQNLEDDDPDMDMPADSANPQGTNFRYRLVFPDGTVIPFNPENTDKDEVQFARQLYAKEIKLDVAQVIMEALHNFVELSRQYDFIPIVTYTPSAHTAYEANVVFEDPSLNELMPWFNHEQREFLRTNGEELGYIFIDFTPTLQLAAQTNSPQELLYYAYNLHLTLAGHTVIAETLSQNLQDLPPVKKRPIKKKRPIN